MDFLPGMHWRLNAEETLKLKKSSSASGHRYKKNFNRKSLEIPEMNQSIGNFRQKISRCFLWSSPVWWGWRIIAEIIGVCQNKPETNHNFTQITQSGIRQITLRNERFINFLLNTWQLCYFSTKSVVIRNYEETLFKLYCIIYFYLYHTTF